MFKKKKRCVPPEEKKVLFFVLLLAPREGLCGNVFSLILFTYLNYLKHFHFLIDLWFCIYVFNVMLVFHRTGYLIILFIFPIRLRSQLFGNMIWVELPLTKGRIISFSYFLKKQLRLGFVCFASSNSIIGKESQELYCVQFRISPRNRAAISVVKCLMRFVGFFQIGFPDSLNHFFLKLIYCGSPE